MLCGVKFTIVISFKHYIFLSRKFNLKVSKGYNETKEYSEDGICKRNGQHKNLIIEVQKNNNICTLMVRGSIHKFYHSNNKGLFTGMEVLSALDAIANLFDIDPTKAFVNYVEVGINIPLLYPIYPYLESNLLYHKKKYKGKLGRELGFGYEFKYDDYLVKLYAKDEHLLRFEVKYKSQVKKLFFGITFLSDLNEENIMRLAASLITEWNEIVMKGNICTHFDKSNPCNLTKNEQNKFKDFVSDAYQNDYKKLLLKANKKCKEALRQEAYRLKEEVMAIINERGDKEHKKLENEIIEGVEVLKKSFAGAGGSTAILSRIPM